MSIAERIKTGEKFWAGEDIVTYYQFSSMVLYTEPGQSPGSGYIKKDGQHYYCDVRAIHNDHMEVYYKFFGTWIDSVIKYKDIAFSTDELVARIKPVITPKHRPARGPVTRDELVRLIRLVDKLCDEVPNGLSSLKDALTFALLDLRMYARFDHKGKDFEKAVTFARSIPPFDDVKSDECTRWMLNDEEHLKYM